MKILTLGPEGTFSSEAARQLFPNEQIIYASDFTELRPIAAITVLGLW